MFRWVKAALSLLLTGVLVWVLNTSHGQVPAFGKFLSPFEGFWRNGEADADFAAEQTLTLPGLQQPVTVRFDDKRVPHVFAQNDHDLYYAQGYLTARDRLWQMEFQTHVAAGRLSEIVGEGRLETDRFFRRMGMGYGAQKSLDAMMSDPTTRTVLTAYSAGVNAYIGSLAPRDLPFEYKLLNYRPEPWQPLKCALLLKFMAWDLSGRSDDLRMSNALSAYGSAVVQDLFPDYPQREDPIVPVGTPLDYKPVAVPEAPNLFKAALSNRVPQHEPDPELGSNNWAVSGAKTATGLPMLANDPHLQLNLPSIWYQMQLTAPGVNVYGVTIPGAPTIIIGFNQQAAWGVTNVGADVVDWYQIRFKDHTKREYWHDGRWKPVRRVVEHIKVRGLPDRLDTVLYTHHGPVVYDHDEKPFLDQTPIRHALRWTAHDPANEVLAFYRLNRARSYQDYTAALASYGSPAQNFIFASNQNDIAIWPNGRFPLKWRDQGKFILDGTDPAYDWQGWIPAAQNPHVKNPARGFVSSANQFSAGPDYPYYLGWSFGSYERGHRINQRLARMTQATVDSLRLLQNDNLNLNAQLMLPRMLDLVQPAQLTADQRRAYDELRRWNYFYDANAIGPSIFELWYTNLVKHLWEDDFGTQPGRPMRYPGRDRTNTLLLQEPTSKWIDDRRTPGKETLDQLALNSLQWATDSLQRKFGPLGPEWRWAHQKSTDILHLAQLPGFGRMDLDCGGGAGIVNATSERNGPSWRMVVALGPEPKAYGVFPGGQSGNPGSRHYDDLIETWRVGQLNELVFLHSAAETNPRVPAAWQLRP
ncbi:penicillin acylase family protein [Hymenobacter busanensis]|uniref:Penicillin acylase family protein n=2 Tax=Hymenobacter busanensis TaxID=2607656 RepID=A0A7L5A4E8_9BACT|nr:penicillin acylase family protein [Hymenobacter busanensis]KAA9331693.1 penicillin acylase family protein [Hymenobacter busanensis]QHJ09722.1 penicillin acylase family protein [Hymenobacter busanensis]